MAHHVVNHICDETCRETRKITKDLLERHPKKKWVIDAGSLQTMDPEWIPEGAIITPNKREFEILFSAIEPGEAAKKYKCIIVVKGPSSFVYSDDVVIEVKGGNPGLTKGGSGDVQAGLTVALLAKNDPVLSACSAAFIEKKAADELYKTVGVYYNSDDLAKKVPEVLNLLTR